jgi:hypothetical protein
MARIAAHPSGARKGPRICSERYPARRMRR